ncbi:MAG: hypothetical protein P4N24_15745 [Acidobacteriota bacterium]|nr:hypothetical protein [Acidobacteriota bacterium]
MEMAIGSLDSHPSPNPLDMDMSDIGESPTDLDLPLPGKLESRHAAETGAARGGTKRRS